VTATRLLRVGLTVSELTRAETFYRDALGFSRIRGGAVTDPAWFRLMGVGGTAHSALMKLGAQELKLVAFTPRGRPYPARSTATDSWFQHIAIVVDDIAVAYQRLQNYAVTPITTSGPQHLPPGAGSVTAFKFRDPDGHPLELIQFPPGSGNPAWQAADASGVFLGYDHSAIVVRDVAASTRFYVGLLGLSEVSRSHNHGPEQERLDDAANVQVDVVALKPRGAGTPHVELLGYRVPPVAEPPADGSISDIAATRLELEVDDLSATVADLRDAGVRFVSPGAVTCRDGSRAALVHDPDGHAILLVSVPAKT
jgi:catechol 2,3-dioxygenase-like lactoylglutathione lyase family enzyme